VHRRIRHCIGPSCFRRLRATSLLSPLGATFFVAVAGGPGKAPAAASRLLITRLVITWRLQFCAQVKRQEGTEAAFVLLFQRQRHALFLNITIITRVRIRFYGVNTPCPLVDLARNFHTAMPLAILVRVNHTTKISWTPHPVMADTRANPKPFCLDLGRQREFRGKPYISDVLKHPSSKGFASPFFSFHSS